MKYLVIIISLVILGYQLIAWVSPIIENHKSSMQTALLETK
jgi:hypothetical protein